MSSLNKVFFQNRLMNPGRRRLNDFYFLSYPKVASGLRKKGIKLREFEGLEFIAS